MSHTDSRELREEGNSTEPERRPGLASCRPRHSCIEDMSTFSEPEIADAIDYYLYSVQQVFTRKIIGTTHREKIREMRGKVGDAICGHILDMYIEGQGRMSFAALCRLVEKLYVEYGGRAVFILKSVVNKTPDILLEPADTIVYAVSLVINEVP